MCKIEPPSGDPLRRAGTGESNREVALFEYFNAGKRGTTIDLADARATSRPASDLIAGADVLGRKPARQALPERREWGLDKESLERINPHLVVVRISDFGQEGPLRDRGATPLTMQAAAGWISVREPARAPVQAGARIPGYVAGAYCGPRRADCTAYRRSRTNRVVEVDVSIFESLLSTLPYPDAHG